MHVSNGNSGLPAPSRLARVGHPDHSLLGPISKLIPGSGHSQRYDRSPLLSDCRMIGDFFALSQRIYVSEYLYCCRVLGAAVNTVVVKQLLEEEVPNEVRNRPKRKPLVGGIA